MTLEHKIKLLEVMQYEAENEADTEFYTGYRSALSNVLDILKSDYFAQVMIDYYTRKGE